MFDIKRYFGRRSSDGIDEEITREAPLKIRGDAPGTTTFNRKMVIGLAGGFTLIFAFSMFYGMSSPAPDKKKEDMALKERKVGATTIGNNSQLDKLPSSYEGKNQNKNSVPPANLTGENSVSKLPMQDNYSSLRQPPINYSPPRQSYQSVDYSSPPPIPGGNQQRYDSFEPTAKQAVFTATTVADPVAVVSKEEQEVAEARKSPIRFNVK